MFADFSYVDFGEEPMPWIRRDNHDAEASGHGKAPVIDIPSDE